MAEEGFRVIVPELDPKISKWCKKLIFDSIRSGTAFYNEGKVEECYEEWRKTVEQLIKKLQEGEEVRMLQTSLDISKNKEPNSRPWMLRISLETFSWIHFNTKASFDIHSATANGYLEQVQILAPISSLVNHPKGPHLPLHIACNRSNHEIAKTLLQHSADPNCPTADDGLTPLQISSSKGDLEMVKLLISYKAALEVTRDTWTALHFAVENSHLEVAKELISSGAEKSPVASYMIGNEEKLVTPLDMAIQNGDKHIITGILSFTEVKPQRFLTLSKLRLNQVNLELFPPGVTQLSCLTRLDLSYNQLRTIPDIISTMTNLRELDFSHTELNSFPINVCDLKSLGKLNLNFNNISELPGNITGLSRLERLDISNNQLISLPEELGSLTRLRKLTLEGNPLHSIPRDMLLRGTSRLLDYLRQISGCSADWKKMKLVLVGEENVGKTSLLKSLRAYQTKSGSIPSLRKSKPKPAKKEEPSISTDGVDVGELSIDDNVLFSTWDFAGQQLFYQTHQFFLTSRSIYIIVFNLVKTYESRIKYWLRQIRATSSDRPPVILVGTHLDDSRCNSRYLQSVRDNMERKFPFKMWNIIQLHFISVKTDKGFRKLNKTLRGVAIKHKTITQKVPETFIMLDRLLIQEKTKNQYICWDDYCRLAQECSIPSASINVVTSFLHDVGCLIHYDSKESGLDQLVILDPQWLADIMSSLISFKHQWVKTGILTLDLLPQVWKEYPSEHHQSLLALLTKFEVAVKLKSSQESFYVIPTLLPEEPPNEFSEDLVWKKLPDVTQYQFGRVYQFSFDFDFSKLIARVFSLAHIDVQFYWKNGLYLRYQGESDHDKELAFVDWKPRGCRLSIQVRAERTTYEQRELIFLRLLVEMIESILESFYPGIQDGVQRLVPCCHCIESGDILLGPYFFTYEECVSAVTNGKSYVYCRGVPTRPVNICYLAPDIAFKDFPIVDPEDLSGVIQVAAGGFGLVFKGFYQEKTEVAIKELISDRQESAQDSLDKFKEFQREVGIMSGLNHANLVHLYGITIKPHLRMIMEWCPEGDLYHFLLSGKEIDWKLRIRICIDIAKGMRYLQGVTPPIIHRDLRSPNIFMMSTNPSAFVVAKVADFGLSLRVEHRVGGFLPTWRWLAPEVIDVSNVYYDQTADIYSFAIVLWEIVTRDSPFFEYEHIREMQIKHKIIHEYLRPSIPKDCPLELSMLIRDCWAANPKDRPNFDESVKVLTDLLHKLYPDDYQKLAKKPRKSFTVQKSAQHPLNRLSPQQDRNSSSLSRFKSVSLLDLPEERSSGVYSILLVGTRVWTGHTNGYIIVWDVILRTVVESFKAHPERVEALILVEGCVWSSAKEIKVWDCRTFQNITTLKEPHASGIRILNWVSVSPDESFVWSGDTDGLICIWDIQSAKLVRQLKMEEPVNCIYHFGQFVWVGLYRSLYVFDCSAIEQVQRFEVNTAHDIVASRGKIWVACNDKIRIWDAVTLDKIRDLEGHTSKVVCIIEAGSRIWSASFDTTILVWNSDTYICTQELKGVHLDTITCLVEAGFDVVWSADRRGVLSVWTDKDQIGVELNGQFEGLKVRGHKRMRSKSCK